MANKDNENKIKKFTKEAIGKTLNEFNKEIGMADLVEINKNQDRILNGILSQVNDENTEKTEKSNVIMLDNSTDGIVELQEIQGDTNVNVSKIVEETPITHVIEDKEGNVISLDDITEGAINIDNIQGNTMVNCNKEPDKELVLMEDLSTQGYSNVTLTEGVDGGLVDVALEGNTMVNVCDPKDPVAITKSYAVETGNHVALQGEYDGKCRPVVTGNTLVNLYKNISAGVFTNNVGFIGGKTYTIVTDLEVNGSGKYILEINSTWVQLYSFTNLNDGLNHICISFTTPNDIVLDARIMFSPRVNGNIVVNHSNSILLEGDYTNKPLPDYFEGMQSSFEDKVVNQEMVDAGEELAENLDKYKVEYKVTGKNKFDGDITLNYAIDSKDGYSLNSNTSRGHTTNFIPVNSGSNITISSCTVTSVSTYDKNKSFVKTFGILNINPIPDNVKYIRFNINTTVDYSFLQIEEGTEATSYEPYKEYKKTFYLNSPLLEGDTIEQQGDNVVHVHRSEIRAYETDDELTLPTDMTNTLVAKATPQYEVISRNDTILCDSYVNGHLDVDSVVPIEKVKFGYYYSDLKYLYPSTQYTVQFEADNNGKIDWMTLGGIAFGAGNISVTKGLNKITATIGDTLNNSLIGMVGIGFNASNIVVTQAIDQDFGYFEGMKSVGECEDNKLIILSKNKNIFPYNNVTIPAKSVQTWYDINGKSGMFGNMSNVTNTWVYVGRGYLKATYTKNNALLQLVTSDERIIDASGLTLFEGGLVTFRIRNENTEQPFGYSNLSMEWSPTPIDNNINYVPHKSHKTEILMNEPLRAVGNVKDKYVLIDGKWYIERNCGEVVLDSNQFAIKDNTLTNTIRYGIKSDLYTAQLNVKSNGNCISINLPYYGFNNDDIEHVRIDGTAPYGAFRIWLNKDKPITDINNIKVIYELASPTYEEIDYNPFTVYSDITHISNNSAIPCNMTIKNTGYNCLLKPSTTYTVSSNLGLNLVTTPSTLTEDCLRFYDADTSDVTTMKNVTILEGDYTTGKPLPSHFSGMESAFEQEYDEAVGKYKVKVRVQNEDASKENYIEFYINEPLRGIRDAKDKVYVKDDKVVVERKCGSVTLDGSDDENLDKASINYDSINNISFALINISNISSAWSNSKAILSSTLPSVGNKVWSGYQEGITSDATKIIICLNRIKLQTQDIQGFKQWLQQNPTTVVYQLKTPTYEEVEYSSNRLILDTYNNESFNNSTLFYESNIPVSNTSFKPLWEELVYLKNSTKYYIQFNSTASGTVVINLGGTELTTEIVEGYNCIPITTPSESTNLMTIIGQGITISEVVVSEVICGGYYKGLQSCFEEHMENGKYRVLLRGIALDGSKVNGIKLYLDEPLRGIGDVKDRLCIKNGKLMVERKCASVTLDGTGNIYDVTSWGASSDKTIEFRLGYNQFENKKGDILCDNFISKTSNLWVMDTEGIQSYTTDTVDIRINKNKLSTPDVNGFKQWLQQNPTTVVYQLTEPTYKEATNEYGLPIVFEGYENGIVYIDSAVTPTTHIKYTSNNQLATTLSEAEEQNIATQEDINMNVVTYMMDIDMILTEMEMSNDTSVMAVRRDSSNENMLDRMSKEDKKVYQDNTVVMLEKMITANVLEKEDIEGRINMYYNKNRISKEQYEHLKSLL